MTTTTKIDQIAYRWDRQQGAEPGWYCRCWSGNTLVTDSQKITFPVDLDEFGEDDEAGVEAALQEAFPGAEITVG